MATVAPKAASSREASFVYATESMRLTTRLMQLASWLLLQRAVNEGELTAANARAEKEKVKFSATPSERGGPVVSGCASERSLPGAARVTGQLALGAQLGDPRADNDDAVTGHYARRGANRLGAGRRQARP